MFGSRQCSVLGEAATRSSMALNLAATPSQRIQPRRWDSHMARCFSEPHHLPGSEMPEAHTKLTPLQIPLPCSDKIPANVVTWHSKSPLEASMEGQAKVPCPIPSILAGIEGHDQQAVAEQVLF